MFFDIITFPSTSLETPLGMNSIEFNDGIHRISMDSIEVQLIIIDLLEFEWMLFN